MTIDEGVKLLQPYVVDGKAKVIRLGAMHLTRVLGVHSLYKDHPEFIETHVNEFLDAVRYLSVL